MKTRQQSKNQNGSTPRNHPKDLATRLIDRRTIDSYFQMGKARNKNVLELILNKYLIYSNKAINDLQHKLSQQDFQTIEELAHTLKSSAAQVGALQLAKIFEKIESDANHQNLKSLSHNYYSEMMSHHSDVTDALIYIIEHPETWLNSCGD